MCLTDMICQESVPFFGRLSSPVGGQYVESYQYSIRPKIILGSTSFQAAVVYALVEITSYVSFHFDLSQFLRNIFISQD